MQDRLARRLLGSVLGWDASQLSKQQDLLDALARIKYDEYQQFQPGMKFIESLAVWLSQFKNAEEKLTAYDFIREHLIFISSQEMNHLVDISYSKVIRPILIDKVAQELGKKYWEFNKICNSLNYRELQRRSLFLALSDGAKIDRFRRTNGLSNEQVHASYELSIEKVNGFIQHLHKDIAKYRQVPEGKITREEATFKNVFLLDDFSGSGLSLIREKEENDFKGKLDNFHKRIFGACAPLANALDPNGFDVYVVIYVMTESAKQYVKQQVTKLWKTPGVNIDIKPILILQSNIKITRDTNNPMEDIIEKYYDHSVWDKNFEEGKTKDARYGFADAGLPLILSHNTPNDSLYLLWGYEDKEIHGLFPRISRHKEEP